jgi:hypothetical protein
MRFLNFFGRSYYPEKSLNVLKNIIILKPSLNLNAY